MPVNHVKRNFITTQIFWVKINYDIAIRPNFSLATAVCRNDKGEVLFGHSSFSPETFCPAKFHLCSI